MKALPTSRQSTNTSWNSLKQTCTAGLLALFLAPAPFSQEAAPSEDASSATTRPAAPAPPEPPSQPAAPAASAAPRPEPASKPAPGGRGKIQSISSPSGTVHFSAPGAATNPIESRSGYVAPGFPGLTQQKIAEGMLQEEGGRDLVAAAESFRRAISAFDEQRPHIANAIFRLAETYRKMNRIEEARMQYARILREFPDQAELARQSHDLFQSLSRRTASRLEIVPRSDADTASPRANSPGGFGAEQPLAEEEISQPDANVRGGTEHLDLDLTPVTTSTPEHIREQLELAQQLTAAKARIARHREEQKRLESILQLVSRSPAAHTLPPALIAHPSYQALKREYEAAVLDGDKAQLDSVLNKMQKWLDFIFLPETETYLRFVQRQLQEAIDEANKLEQQLDEARRQDPPVQTR